MTQAFHILFGDDDRQFLTSTVTHLQRQLTTRIPDIDWHITPVSSLAALRKIVTTPQEAQHWQMFFCDLGWGDLNLEGIQILHDMQMNHPHVVTVLYTAQDANQAVDQALEWQFQFIDHVLRVDDSSTFRDEVLRVIQEHLMVDDLQFAGEVGFTATHLVPKPQQPAIIDRIAREMRRLQRNLYAALAGTTESLAFELQVAPNQLQVRFRPDPGAEQNQRIAELIDNTSAFPRVAPHDLLPLMKARYIQFIKDTYGGFPAMAKARGVDLNNIYRVNRRFKNAPFVVFKFETIQEIIGIYETEPRIATIQSLLCPASLLRRAMAV